MAPSGSPALEATLKASPSPAPNVPVFSSTAPGRGGVLELEVHDPGDMASELYCAAAPSRTSGGACC